MVDHTSIEIKEVGDAQADILLEIINPIILQGGTTAIETPLTKALMQDWLKTARLCAHLASSPTGMPLGFQLLHANPNLPSDCGDIATYVSQNAARRGVGSALFFKSCARAKELGFAQINATIRCDNALGLAYYAKMGFVDDHYDHSFALSNGTIIGRVNKRYNCQIS